MSDYKLDGDKFIRIKDDKHVANLVDGEIKATAPAYGRAEVVENLKEILSESELSATDVTYVESPTEEWPKPIGQESGLAEDQPSAEEVAEQIEAANKAEAGGLVEPVRTLHQGDRTPGYPTWLHKTDPGRAKKHYEGKRCAEYEALIAAEK